MWHDLTIGDYVRCFLVGPSCFVAGMLAVASEKRGNQVRNLTRWAGPPKCCRCCSYFGTMHPWIYLLFVEIWWLINVMLQATLKSGWWMRIRIPQQWIVYHVWLRGTTSGKIIPHSCPICCIWVIDQSPPSENFRLSRGIGSQFYLDTPLTFLIEDRIELDHPHYNKLLGVWRPQGE